MRQILLVLLCLSIASTAHSQIDFGDYFKKDSLRNKSLDPKNTLYQYYKTTKKFNPDDPEGYVKQAVDKLEQQQIKEALTDIEKALSIYPKYDKAWYLKGGCLARLDKMKDLRGLLRPG
jgi:tetratricopeptide (TPR) repeat protein